MCITLPPEHIEAIWVELQRDQPSLHQLRTRNDLPEEIYPNKAEADLRAYLSAFYISSFWETNCTYLLFLLAFNGEEL